MFILFQRHIRKKFEIASHTYLWVLTFWLIILSALDKDWPTENSVFLILWILVFPVISIAERMQAFFPNWPAFLQLFVGALIISLFIRLSFYLEYKMKDRKKAS